MEMGNRGNQRVALGSRNGATQQNGMLGKTVAEVQGSLYMVVASLTAATTASTSTQPSVTVGSMPFIWTELGAHFNETNGDWDIKITDDGKDQAFSSEKVPLIALVGDDKQPYPIPFPHVFDGGSAIMVEGTNNGSGTDTLKLLFIGKRVENGG